MRWTPEPERDQVPREAQVEEPRVRVLLVLVAARAPLRVVPVRQRERRAGPPSQQRCHLRGAAIQWLRFADANATWARFPA